MRCRRFISECNKLTFQDRSSTMREFWYPVNATFLQQQFWSGSSQNTSARIHMQLRSVGKMNTAYDWKKTHYISTHSPKFRPSVKRHGHPLTSVWSTAKSDIGSLQERSEKALHSAHDWKSITPARVCAQLWPVGKKRHGHPSLTPVWSIAKSGIRSPQERSEKELYPGYVCQKNITSTHSHATLEKKHCHPSHPSHSNLINRRELFQKPPRAKRKEWITLWPSVGPIVCIISAHFSLVYYFYFSNSICFRNTRLNSVFIASKNEKLRVFV